MTGLFIFANAIAFGVYFLVHYLDKFAAASAKLAANAKDLQIKATAFNTEAQQGGGANNAEKLKTFQAASAALNEAGQALKELGDLVKVFSERTTNTTKLRSVITTIHGQANNFKTACGPATATPNNNDFYSLADKLNDSSKFPNTGFRNAAYNFGHDNQADSAAKLFKAFSTVLTGSENLSQLKTKAGEFQQACDFFAFAADKFNKAANHPNVTTDGGSKLDAAISGNFNTGATTFERAANDLYNEIKNFTP